MDVNGKVIIDFYADWCVPCQAIAQSLSEIEDEKSVSVIRLNVDTEDDAVSRYGIQAIPTLIYFQNGQEVKRVVGAMSKMDMIQQLGL